MIRLTILLALFSVSCEEPIETSTRDLVPNKDNTTLKFVELPLSVTQAAFDTSIVSSNNVVGSIQQVFFGSNTDNNIGSTTTSAYVGLLLESNFVRDSISPFAQLVGSNMVMRFSNLYGDEFQTGQDIIVEQLSQPISLEARVRYKLADQIPTANRISNVNSTQLFPTLHNPEDTSDSTNSITVSLTTIFGQKVLNALRNEDLSAEELTDVLAGLKISTDGSVNALQGLEISSAKSHLELIYKNSLSSENDTVKFYFSKSSFTHADFEPSGIMPSSYSANRDFQLLDPSKIYFNGLLGIYPKVTIEAYKEFIDTLDYMLIDKAEFVIESSELSEFSTLNQAELIPPVVFPYYMKENGFIDNVGVNYWGIQSNFNSSGQISDQSLPFNLAIFAYNNSAQKISGDVSFYLQEIFNNPDFSGAKNPILLNAQFLNLEPGENPFDNEPLDGEVGYQAFKLSVRSFRKFLVNESDFKLRIYYTTFEN